MATSTRSGRRRWPEIPPLREDAQVLGRLIARDGEVKMLGWAVTINALTMARHRAAEDLEAAA